MSRVISKPLNHLCFTEGLPEATIKSAGMKDFLVLLYANLDLNHQYNLII